MTKFAYLSLALVAVLAACSPTPASETACSSVAGLVASLQSAGADVEFAETIDQDFFSVPAQRLVVNGEDVQVLNYSSTDAARQDAALISSDGFSIGTSMITWIATPHFYQCGQLIVLYLGDDPQALSLLDDQLGQQIAGG